MYPHHIWGLPSVAADGASKGQGWTRHTAPAAPAFTWPSLPFQFHFCAICLGQFHPKVLLPCLPDLGQRRSGSGLGGGGGRLKHKGGAGLPLGSCSLTHLVVFCGGIPPGHRRPNRGGAAFRCSPLMQSQSVSALTSLGDSVYAGYKGFTIFASAYSLTPSYAVSKTSSPTTNYTPYFLD